MGFLLEFFSSALAFLGPILMIVGSIASAILLLMLALIHAGGDTKEIIDKFLSSALEKAGKILFILFSKQTRRKFGKCLKSKFFFGTKTNFFNIHVEDTVYGQNKILELIITLPAAKPSGCGQNNELT